ncbi:chaperone protein [Rhodococcus gordoniae]|uniref:Chaperone protein n=3 Tax=Rhodococcus gordoniae TaxID=223392 RepID=A0A379M1G6_9NOCA|nr:Hsp70 family protein [Rhodococcus gordoniae]SUE15368.1 chaperone protein [Rhodococcus gordoniae]
MYTGLGVMIGTANSVAVTVLDQPGAGDPGVLSTPTELHLPAEGAPALGAGAPAPGTQVFSGYASRVGDPVGILAEDGSTYLGEDLVATTVGCLQHRTGTTEVPTMLAHPATWSAHTVEALCAALVRAGITARTIPEPIAAVRWLDATHGPLGDDVTVVYDLGARSLDVAVVQGGAQPRLLGRPLSSDDVSGDHFDHLVTTYLLGTLGEDAAGLDPFDSATVTALADFRARCRTAKEALSSDTETVVPLALPGLHRDLRLVRSEFEEFAREPLEASLAVVHDAIRGAGLDPSDIGRVLLTGGGSSTPLVAELISSQLGLPIVSSPRPACTAAHGAALAAAAAGAATAVVPAPPAPTPDDEPETVALPVVAAAETSQVTAAHRPAVVDAATGAPARTRARSLALVGAAVAAVVVLAGGGLAIGTLSSEAETTGSDTRPSSEAVAGNPTTETTTGSAVPGTTGTPATEAGSVVPIRVQGPDGSVTVVPAAATPAAGTASTGAVPAPDPAAPAPAAPGGTPQVSQPAPQPAPVPAPAPAPQPAPQPTSPSTGGSGAGDALSGAGQGAGAVVEGVGNGVGQVLDGTGNVVGGVLDGTGQVVGGLLGTGR